MRIMYGHAVMRGSTRAEGQIWPRPASWTRPGRSPWSSKASPRLDNQLAHGAASARIFGVQSNSPIMSSVTRAMTPAVVRRSRAKHHTGDDAMKYGWAL
jgi:hypothetical protein